LSKEMAISVKDADLLCPNERSLWMPANPVNCFSHSVFLNWNSSRGYDIFLSSFLSAQTNGSPCQSVYTAVINTLCRGQI
jgi:hypothetical protein